MYEEEASPDKEFEAPPPTRPPTSVALDYTELSEQAIDDGIDDAIALHDNSLLAQ